MKVPRVVTALAALLSHSACTAQVPDEWPLCERPLDVDVAAWSADPLARRLAVEVSSGIAVKDAGRHRLVRLGQARDISNGTVRVDWNPESIDIIGPGFGDVARAVVALCNDRLLGHGEVGTADLGAARLWAHFVARDLTESEIAGIVREVAATGYYGVIIDIGGWLHSSALPGAHEPGALDGDAWARVVALARALGLTVVPEVKLLTHQQKLLGLSRSYEGLLLNPYTYDPDQEALKPLIEDYVDEVLQAFSPPAVHIGHDEVALSGEGLQPLRRNARRLVPEQFVRSVRFLDGLLARRRVDTWMWADMLLNPREFPQLPEGEMNGTQGFAETVHALPKRIVLLDWHYYSPANCTVAAHWLRGLGFRVMTAGWSRADALACQLRGLEADPPAIRAEAQVVTTWSHVQRRNWQKVREILRQGANLYEASAGDGSTGSAPRPYSGARSR